MNKVTDYIISLTHLYGIVHKDKVIEIYNMQNEEKLKELININLKSLEKNFVEVYGDYFVAESILEFEQFDEKMNVKRGKPYYIPIQDELLKYKDEIYFEKTKEYKELLNYVTQHFFNGDKYLAEILVEDVQGDCQYGFSLQSVFEKFNRRDVVFEDEEQIKIVMKLIMNLANNTRIWENNGHTPNEIFEMKEKPKLRPVQEGGILNKKKIGRNDPCPCGSGKKYKKCCLGK